MRMKLDERLKMKDYSSYHKSKKSSDVFNLKKYLFQKMTFIKSRFKSKRKHLDID